MKDRRRSGSAWMLYNNKVSHTNIIPLQAFSIGRFLLCVCQSCFSNTPARIRRYFHPLCRFWPFLSLLRWPCNPPPYRRIWTEHDHAILISLVRIWWSCIMGCQAVCMCVWERVFHVFQCAPVCVCVRVHGIRLCLYLRYCANAQARICAGVRVYVCVCVCVSLSLSLSLSLRVHVCVYACARSSACVCVCVCVWVCVYACACSCVCVCVSV